MASLGTPGSEHGALVGTKNHKLVEKYSILFVCDANMCRSPMAAVSFKAFLKSQGQSEANWRVESAGIRATQNCPATTNAQEVVAEQGLDLSHHLSQAVTKDLVESFHLILTMAKLQQQILHQLCPDISNRVLMLSQVIGIEKDITDPTGMPKNIHYGILKEIQSYFKSGWKKILLLSRT